MNERPNRKTIRLQAYDYRSKGCYHVTICSRQREHLFGEVANGVMRLNALGRVVEQGIAGIPSHFPEAEVIAHVVMPNHVHMLLGLGTETDAMYGVPTARHTLGQIIGSYKAGVSRACGRAIWQPRFYEHIIRNERDLLETIAYVQNNPMAWDRDALNAPTPLVSRDEPQTP